MTNVLRDFSALSYLYPRQSVAAKIAKQSPRMFAREIEGTFLDPYLIFLFVTYNLN